MMIVSTSLPYNPLLLHVISLIDPFVLSERHQDIIKPLISSQVQASLSTWLGAPKWMIAAIIKFDKLIIQYGQITCLDGGTGDTMIARDIVHESKDTCDASYVKVSFFFCIKLMKLISQISSIYKILTNLLLNKTAPPSSFLQHFLVNSSVYS